MKATLRKRPVLALVTNDTLPAAAAGVRAARAASAAKTGQSGRIAAALR
ncbi:MAG: hypothetical protein II839_03405 [Kiritimatiellae bacterium]|nr:hypothetical protein [Kiritimatiellia bacterium]